MTAGRGIPPGPSFWWDSVGGLSPRRSPLPGSTSVDVAVIGAGYTGLWTAYELARAHPGLDIVVLEREHAGFGASGRNGGWLSGLLAGPRRRYAAGGDRAGVVAAQREMFRTVGEVLRVCADEGIDCDAAHGGTLRVATNGPALERLRTELADERAWGFGEEDWRLLDPGELSDRLRVAGARGGLFSPHCARVHPVKLLLGLAAAVERRGVRIHERTPVLSIVPGRAVTAHGDVRARWIVRATEGYTADLPGLRRELLPLNSAMIVTERLAAPVWDDIGWSRCETVLDATHAYAYLQRTADSRIAIGGRGRPYRFGSRTDRSGEIPASTVDDLRARLVRLFPSLAGVRVDSGWTGVLGVPRDWCAAVHADPATGLCWAGGYAGDGVSTANLAGRTLRDLILGRDTELTRLPWVGHRTRRWEPEPLRWLGVTAVYGALTHADANEARSDRPSRLAGLAGRVAGR